MDFFFGMDRNSRMAVIEERRFVPNSGLRIKIPELLG